jgi:predicted double-glycine peptidase
MLLAILLIISISAAAFFAGRRTARRAPQNYHVPVLLACIALAMAYVSLARDSTWQIMFMHLTNTIIYGKWLLVIAAFAAGLLSKSSIIRPFSRIFLVPALLMVAFLDFGVYFLFPRPHGGYILVDSVIGQSSDVTCSPAACATFLRLYGVDASEQQMVEACLTTRSGTSKQGIWRALKMYAPKGYEACVVRFRDYHNLPFPILVNMKLKDSDSFSSRYPGQWGWKPGVPHTVVLMGQAADGKLLVADPASGKDIWDLQALDVLWDKRGFILKHVN